MFLYIYVCMYVCMYVCICNGLITQSTLVSEQNLVVVGSNPTQTNFL